MRDFLRLRQRYGEIERSEEELVGLACIVCRGFPYLVKVYFAVKICIQDFTNITENYNAFF